MPDGLESRFFSPQWSRPSGLDYNGPQWTTMDHNGSEWKHWPSGLDHNGPQWTTMERTKCWSQPILTYVSQPKKPVLCFLFWLFPVISGWLSFAVFGWRWYLHGTSNIEIEANFACMRVYHVSRRWWLYVENHEIRSRNILKLNLWHNNRVLDEDFLYDIWMIKEKRYDKTTKGVISSKNILYVNIFNCKELNKVIRKIYQNITFLFKNYWHLQDVLLYCVS